MGKGARPAVKDPLRDLYHRLQFSEEDDEDEDLGALPPKKIHVSKSMDMEKEQKLVDFFTSNPIFYDQTVREFKDRGWKDHLLADVGDELGLTGRCTFLIKRSSNISATL